MGTDKFMIPSWEPAKHTEHTEGEPFSDLKERVDILKRIFLLLLTKAATMRILIMKNGGVMNNSAVNYRAMVLKELTKVPEEFIPFVFEQIKAYNKGLKRKKITRQSPTTRLLNLAGALENPGHLTARQYKKKVVDEYLAQTR